MIADNKENEINQFSSYCEKLKSLIVDQNTSLSVDEFLQVFPKEKLRDYLLIPHYLKSPKISNAIINELSNYTAIVAGEVSSVRKFTALKNNNETTLTPVLFSDQRVSDSMDSYSIQQTYINISEISLSAIKYALSDKTKVSLSLKDGKNLFDLSDGIVASTGLNILIGERSSGKTFLMDRIFETTSNARYIKQFELVEKSDQESEENFNAQLVRDQSMFREDYLKEFRDIINIVGMIDQKQTDLELNKYTRSLIQNAENTEKKDAFAKASLFSEIDFKIKPLDTLEELIKSVQNLLSNKEYSQLIYSLISKDELEKLLHGMITEYRRLFKVNLFQKKTNEIILDIRRELQMKTPVQRIEDLDFNKVAEEIIIKKHFNKVTKTLQEEKELDSKGIYDFTIMKSKSPFKGAREVLNVIKKQISFSEVFKHYNDPFEYLQHLKNKNELEQADLVKYFVKINIEILNKDRNPVSGGQRAEYNFLRKIEDALKYDMLLIDEPEASFDNVFLNTKINKVLQDISKNIPVFVSTHNNTIGASIKPDYVLHTKRYIEDNKVKFKVYSGYPSDKVLKSNDNQTVNSLIVLLNCLEAGEETYNLRRDTYEILKN